MTRLADKGVKRTVIPALRKGTTFLSARRHEGYSGEDSRARPIAQGLGEWYPKNASGQTLVPNMLKHHHFGVTCLRESMTRRASPSGTTRLAARVYHTEHSPEKDFRMVTRFSAILYLVFLLSGVTGCGPVLSFPYWAPRDDRGRSRSGS